MNMSNESILVVSEDHESWKTVLPEAVCSKSFKEAKIKLLESSFDSIVFDSLTGSDTEQLISFIEGLRGHPKLSSLTVYVCEVLADSLDESVLEELRNKKISVISGSSHFSSSLASQVEVSFDFIFSEVKEKTAKCLAQLKIENIDNSLADRKTLIEKYIEILRRELK